MSDKRITWFVNDHEGRNTRGLGAYWGYLIGALDRRNFATLYHAPIEHTPRSAASSSSSSSSGTEGENEMEQDDSSSIPPSGSQVSIFTQQSVVSSESTAVRKETTSNGQQMPPNSMPNTSNIQNRPSVIVMAEIPPVYQPPPALVPADIPQNWADDGKLTFNTNCS